MGHPLGRGRILRSPDGERWETAVLLDWDCADVREPKLSVTAEDRLMVNTSLKFVSREPREGGDAGYEAGAKYYRLDDPKTKPNDEEKNVTRQSTTWLSEDGQTWSSAWCCPSGVNTWRWEVSWHDGMGYSIGYDGKDQTGTLYRTRDGKSWRVLTQDLFPDGHGNEGSIAFGEDGTAVCLLRGACPRESIDEKQTVRNSDGHEIAKEQARKTHGTDLPMLGIGKAPYYQEWSWKPLTVDYGPDYGGPRPAQEMFRAPFGGPKVIRLQDGRFMAAARMLSPGRDDGRITLYMLDPEEALLTYVDECAGTTYGSIVEHEGQIWVSFAKSDVTQIRVGQIPVPGL
jgi:hypothetical protein